MELPHTSIVRCGLWVACAAEAEKRYLKSEFDHLGVTVWEIRREVKVSGEEHPSLWSC